MKAAAKKNNQSGASMSQSFFNKGTHEAFFSKAGNENTGTFFNSITVQPSLEIGRPDDPYEKEADTVASQVVNGMHEANSVQKKPFSLGLQQMTIQPLQINSRISRKLQKIISKKSLFLQTKCSHCEEEEKMQKKTGNIQFEGGGSTVSSDMENKIQGMKGGGNAMDNATKTVMENSFGADFSNVKVHTNSQAIQMSQQLNAHAFTVGSDIFFNQGRYQPQNKAGTGLLAHELAHTIQQGSGLQNKQMDNASDLEKLAGNQSLGNMISFGSIKKMTGLDKKRITKKGLGLKLQRCPEGTPVKVKYASYGGTGFSPASGGGSCPAYCACAENDAQGKPITAGQDRWGQHKPVNGRCAPGLEIVWDGATIKSETELDTAPCTYGAPGQTRKGCM